MTSLDGAAITEELELDTNPKALEAIANDSRNFALDNIINFQYAIVWWWDGTFRDKGRKSQ